MYNKKMKFAKTFLIVILVPVVIVILYFIQQKVTGCRQMSCLKMDNLQNYNLKNIDTEYNDVFRGNYENGTKTIQAEILSKMDADAGTQYTNAGIAKIKGLYADAPAPYPGVISDEITCGQLYRPLYKTLKSSGGVEVSYFNGYFNGEDVFGACSEDQAKSIGVLAFFYCQNTKQAIKLAMFEPDIQRSGFDQYEQMLSSINC